MSLRVSAPPSVGPSDGRAGPQQAGAGAGREEILPWEHKPKDPARFSRENFQSGELYLYWACLQSTGKD